MPAVGLRLQTLLATVVGRFRLSMPPEMCSRQALMDRMVFRTFLQAEGGVPLLATPRVR